MSWIASTWNFIVQTILQELVVVFFGVLFALTFQRMWDRIRYDHWKVEIRQGGATVLNKKISSGKAKAILDVPEDMGVFLKGLISPFAWLNCDLMDEGPALGLLNIDRRARRIVIDLDKNPPEDSPTEQEKDK